MAPKFKCVTFSMKLENFCHFRKMSDLSDVQSQIENVISILSRFQTSILRQTEEGLGSFSQSLSEVVPDEVARNGQGVDNCLESVYEHVEKRVMEYFPALEEFVVTRLAIPPKDLVAPPAADLVPAVSDVELAVATAQIEDLYKKIIYVWSTLLTLLCMIDCSLYPCVTYRLKQ